MADHQRRLQGWRSRLGQVPPEHLESHLAEALRLGGDGQNALIDALDAPRAGIAVAARQVLRRHWAQLASQPDGAAARRAWARRLANRAADFSRQGRSRAADLAWWLLDQQSVGAADVELVACCTSVIELGGGPPNWGRSPERELALSVANRVLARPSPSPAAAVPPLEAPRDVFPALAGLPGEARPIRGVGPAGTGTVDSAQLVAGPRHSDDSGVQLVAPQTLSGPRPLPSDLRAAGPRELGSPRSGSDASHSGDGDGMPGAGGATERRATSALRTLSYAVDQATPNSAASTGTGNGTTGTATGIASGIATGIATGTTTGIAEAGSFESALHALFRQLSQADADAQREALNRLQTLGYTPQEIAVARGLFAADSVARRQAVEQLMSLGIDANPWLLWATRDDDPLVRRAAITIMATSNDPRLLARVAQLASDDPDVEVRRLAQQVTRRR